jgi:hypothetical protein
VDLALRHHRRLRAEASDIRVPLDISAWDQKQHSIEARLE